MGGDWKRWFGVRCEFSLPQNLPTYYKLDPTKTFSKPSKDEQIIMRMGMRTGVLLTK